MEETKPVIEWHQFKDSHVAIRGDEIIAIIEPIDDFPCKAFTLQIQQGAYSTVEAAKEDALPLLEQFLKQSDAAKSGKRPPSLYLSALRNAVKFLEDQEADSQPEA